MSAVYANGRPAAAMDHVVFVGDRWDPEDCCAPPKDPTGLLAGTVVHVDDGVLGLVRVAASGVGINYTVPARKLLVVGDS